MREVVDSHLEHGEPAKHSEGILVFLPLCLCSLPTSTRSDIGASADTASL
jgi:hypothetical protein